jgi:vancomycin resistance protein VanJ
MGLIVAGAFVYPALLLLTWAVFVLVGEHWWVVSAALYVPRLAFAVPLPFFVIALWRAGKRRLLWTQALAGLIVLLPLMGLVLPWPSRRDEAAPALRLLTFNVNSAFAGTERIVSEIFALSPDIVILQESPWGKEVVTALGARYPHAQESTQFVIASRFPILESTDPDKLPHMGRTRSPRFMRYRVQTPLGPVALYNLHPISPRGALGLHGFRGMFHRVRTGEVLSGDPEGSVEGTATLRALQVATAADMAKTERDPVILAGDMNLPSLSSALQEHLGDFDDGFRSASWGFGYTYPQKYPFLRLDRVLVSAALAVKEFQVGCPGLSDHFCVVATLQRR